ncbi:MAG: HlyD family efflux transporter periplasmic adaptor subunit, partial [Sedimenticolaceae bacterium]
AAVAMFAWLQLSDGLLREAAFAVMLIGGVSTLLFNGNPLLRFDGYYVLSDAIEIPNLATRSARYYGYLARRYLLRIGAERAPNTVQGERRWLLLFGAASTLYRLSITIGIALFLIAVVPTLGVVMAAWLLTAQLALPIGRQLGFLFFSPVLTGRRLRALLTVGGVLATVLVLLALVPMPSSTKVDGVVLLPEQAIVRAGVDGFLDRQLAAHGSEVSRGDLLFVLSNRQLEADIAALQARVEELAARSDAVSFDDRLGHDIHAERLYTVRRELTELEERRDRLSVRSPIDGLLQVPHTDDRLGRLVSQGDLLAYIANESDARVRVVATQEDAARIREAIEHIRVRPAGIGAGIVDGRLLEEVPAASDTLPSAVLGSRGGGAIQVDARDERGLKTLHKVFAFDIAVPFNAATRYVGSRAYVRFEHPARPLMARWYDSVRRLLMDRIGE